jgi:hypothetical protein
MEIATLSSTADSRVNMVLGAVPLLVQPVGKKTVLTSWGTSSEMAVESPWKIQLKRAEREQLKNFWKVFEHH